jgi:hypothetical protein
MSKKANIDLFEKNFTTDKLYVRLVKFISKNYKKWRSKYTNVIGVHIGKKSTNGENVNDDYSIIFHVLDKTDLISKNENIPKSLTIIFNKRKLSILTDVIKTGKSNKNYINPGQDVFQFTNSAVRGTIGVVVFKGGKPYILTNMHVIGYSYLYQTFSVINKYIDFNQNPDISTFINTQIRPVAYFSSGVVDNNIDAAIGLIPPQLTQYINTIGNIVDVGNPLELPLTNVINPFPLNIYGAVSGVQQGMLISTTAIRTFNYPLGGKDIINLIVIKPCISQGGDSGAPLYDPVSKRIAGIVLGSDNERTFTFAIPYLTIKNILGLD